MASPFKKVLLVLQDNHVRIGDHGRLETKGSGHARTRGDNRRLETEGPGLHAPAKVKDVGLDDVHLALVDDLSDKAILQHCNRAEQQLTTKGMEPALGTSACLHVAWRWTGAVSSGRTPAAPTLGLVPGDLRSPCCDGL